MSSTKTKSFSAPKTDKVKILFLDIETFPNIAYVWGKYQQDVIKYLEGKERCLATFAVKWAGEKEVYSRSLQDYPGYFSVSKFLKTSPPLPYTIIPKYDDAAIVKELHAILEMADIIVAHNGDSFDFKVLNARFLFNKLLPPKPFKTIDTKKLAKEAFNFNSNKLDDLGQHLGLGKKIKTDFSLWECCIMGEPKEWSKMIKYNKQDVVLLEKVYYKLAPYCSRLPNISVYNQEVGCAKCGSKRIQFRGESVTTTQRYHRFQCKDCGGWGRTTKAIKTGKKFHTHAVS